MLKRWKRVAAGSFVPIGRGNTGRMQYAAKNDRMKYFFWHVVNEASQQTAGL